VGLGENAVSFRIAFTSGLVSLALRVAEQHDLIAAGCRSFARFRSLSHDIPPPLAPFLMGAADSHIDSGDAEAAAFLVHLITDLDHEIGANIAHDLGHVRHPAHRRVQDETQLICRRRYLPPCG
jgi:hypothetical protein